jgi:iron-sulfur cluster assembly accessory protein
MEGLSTPSPSVSSVAQYPIRLTAEAVSRVHEIFRAQGSTDFVLTVRVVSGGCSGMNYDLNLVKDARPGDLVWLQDGVKIATDLGSSRFLMKDGLPTEIDFVQSVQGAAFKFANPAAKALCGCGTSFST